MKKLGVILAGTILLAGCAGRDAYEQPRYSVLQQQDAIEIRAYEPHLVAEVTATGKDRREAISNGFRKLADYIFGDNVAATDIAMTSPVTQQASSVEIAMTSPVTQSAVANGASNNAWQVQFMMPKEYTLASIPKPVNPEIRLFMTAPEKRAVIVFSGRARDATLATQEQVLRDYLQSQNLQAVGTPIYAYYDPPWTLPWLRRNEVQLVLKN